MKYGRSRAATLIGIVRQLPRVEKRIRYEHAVLQEMIAAHQFDGIISDNRFGLYHPQIPCVFMTHQLLIKSSMGSMIDRQLQKLNYRFINRFSECWVVDEQYNGLAGELSHPSALPAVPVNYIGTLSRFKFTEGVEKKGHLLISLSGPEPQRTILENNLLGQVAKYPGTATIVRGLPSSDKILPSSNDISCFNHLPVSGFADEFAKAEFVISRAGYSTIMDIQKMRKKSILIPTPGQPEQEYLSRQLTEKKLALGISQKAFRLNDALKVASQFDYHVGVNENTLLHDAIRNFLKTITAGRKDSAQ